MFRVRRNIKSLFKLNRKFSYNFDNELLLLRNLINRKITSPNAQSKIDLFYVKLKDLSDFHKLAEDENDSVAIHESESMLTEITQSIDDYLVEVFMEKECNRSASSCLVNIQAGAGGDDACEWTTMLFNMYNGWAKVNSFECELLDHSVEDISKGCRHLMFRVSCNNNHSYPFGWMRVEAGVHRLVRISPFDPAKKRHTSFANVIVTPELGADSSFPIDHLMKSDMLKFETFRSSGPGGQSVNKTDSAVRLTHLPTGVVVNCQNQRSQHQNKAKALTVMRSKIAQMEEDRINKLTLSAAVTDGIQNSFGGNHFRSVVLHPYQKVKDLKTDWECNGADPVRSYLSGELLMDVMMSYVKK